MVKMVQTEGYQANFELIVFQYFIQRCKKRR